MSDYLWDKSGETDPEVKKLEELLHPLAYQDAPLKIGKPTGGGGRYGTNRGRWLAIAAGLVAAVGSTWVYFMYSRPSWEVAGLEGITKLHVGEWIEPETKALLKAGPIGEVDVEPGSRVGLVSSKAGDHRLALDRGSIRATIWAPAGWFYVNTPSAVTVDLGCVYKLQVDDKGAARVDVIGGWVAFAWKDRESLVPAGAACRTRPGAGPGVPYYQDASEPFREGIEKMDVDGIRGALLETVLKEARPRDGFTLWHLLGRAEPFERQAIYDRLSALRPPPAGVTREGAIRLDERMMTDWWNSFDLGNKTWFRLWTVNR